MPVYEDETLRGALRKAIRGARYTQKQESGNAQSPQEMQRRNECQGIRDRIFREASAVIAFESEIRVKVQVLQGIIDEVETAKDAGLDAALRSLGLIGRSLAVARAALRRSKLPRRPSRDDIDEIVDATDIARDLEGVINGLIEIARGQPRIQRLNNELTVLRDQARRHTRAQESLRLQYFAKQCLEFFPL